MMFIESMQELYAAVFVLFLLLATGGWMLHFFMSASGFGWLFSRRNGRRRAHTRALKLNESVCARRAYPVAGTERCPECGAEYTAAGVVIREDVSGPLAWAPFLLRLVSVAAIGLFAAMIVTPSAVAAGNRIYWGAWLANSRYVGAKYTAASLAGTPYYEIRLGADVLVDGNAESSGAPRAPLGGTVHLLLSRNDGGARAHIELSVPSGSLGVARGKWG